MSEKQGWGNICERVDTCALTGAGAFFAAIDKSEVLINGPLWCYFYALRHLEKARPDMYTRFYGSQPDNNAVIYGSEEYVTQELQRMLEDGYMTVKVQTPCLITCIKELNEPRYMSVGGVYESFKKPIAVFDFNTLKDDPLIDLTTIGLKGSPTNIFKSFTPPPKGVGQMLEGADKATCEGLAETLAAKHII